MKKFLSQLIKESLSQYSDFGRSFIKGRAAFVKARLRRLVRTYSSALAQAHRTAVAFFMFLMIFQLGVYFSSGPFAHALQKSATPYHRARVSLTPVTVPNQEILSSIHTAKDASFALRGPGRLSVWRASAVDKPASMADLKNSSQPERLSVRAEFTEAGIGSAAFAGAEEDARDLLVSFHSGQLNIFARGSFQPVARLSDTGPFAEGSRDMFYSSLFSFKNMETALHYGEALDEQGAPVRWTGMTPSSLFALHERSFGMCESVRAKRHDDITGYGFAFAATNRGSAEKYKGYVERYSRKYKLTSSLVYAIMHTESNFNPFAVSPNNALGLMQVVAATAGGEVYSFLNGKQGVPSMEALFDPELNIHYGTAYLHLLRSRYFGDVLNKTSRDICVIAAYNGGPGAVLRVFDKDIRLAVAKINTLTPQALYETLVEKMPSSESRRYVSTVLSRMQNYN